MNKMNMFAVAAVLGLIGIAFGFVACGGEQAPEEKVVAPEPKREKVVIGRVPSGNVVEISEKMEPLVNLMESELGIDVDIRFTTDYTTFTARMQKQDFDLAFCAPFQYINAHEKAGYDAVLRPVRFGSDTYSGVLLTARPDITSIAQLRGKKIAFVDKNSSSGYLFPLGLMISNGLKPGDFQTEFLKGHDNVVLNVLSKSFDAGACYKGAEVTYGKTRSHLLHIIAETDPIYNEPIAISKKFQESRPELAAKIIAFLKNLEKTAEGKRALDRLGENVGRFVDASDTDYDSVRHYAAALPPEIIQASGQ